MKTILVSFVLLIFLINCSDNSVSPANEISEARQKWESLGYDSYSFNYRQSCFCIWGGVEFKIRVNENKIADVVDIAGNVIVDTSDYKYLYTIDQLFNYLENASKQNPAQLDYSFHQQLGYPQNVFVDYNKQMVDEEFGFTVDSLVALTGFKNIIIIDDFALIDLKGDPLQINSVSVFGDNLQISVSYSGGCKEHEFGLFAGRAFMKSNPVRSQLILAHNANNDSCEAWITETLSFNLQPLKKIYQNSYGNSGSIYLRIATAADSTTYDPMPLYSF